HRNHKTVDIGHGHLLVGFPTKDARAEMVPTVAKIYLGSAPAEVAPAEISDVQNETLRIFQVFLDLDQAGAAASRAQRRRRPCDHQTSRIKRCGSSRFSLTLNRREERPAERSEGVGRATIKHQGSSAEGLSGFP